MFRMFRIFSNVQNVQNLFSLCLECSVMIRLCSEYLAQKLVCSESLDFVVVLNNEYLSYPNISVKLLLLLVRS